MSLTSFKIFKSIITNHIQKTKIGKLIKILKQTKKEHEVYPVATNKDLNITEAKIKAVLPKSYVEFVRRFSNGGYLFFIQEVCSVGDSNKKIASIHSVFHKDLLTGKALSHSNLNRIIPINNTDLFINRRNLIPFSLDSNGNAWCFLVFNGTIKDEYPVAYLDSQNLKLYGLLSGFTEWLSILISEKEEVIRVVCNEETILGELKLG